MWRLRREQLIQQQIENMYLIFCQCAPSPPRSPAGASAAELAIHCTATGIQLQCHMKYYTTEMNIAWCHGCGIYNSINSNNI